MGIRRWDQVWRGSRDDETLAQHDLASTVALFGGQLREWMVLCRGR